MKTCETCGQLTEYEGWQTYETWLIAEWLIEDSHRAWYWESAATAADAQAHRQLGDGSGSKLAVEILAEQLEAELGVERARQRVTGVWKELLGAAWANVGWREIAASFLGNED